MAATGWRSLRDRHERDEEGAAQQGVQVAIAHTSPVGTQMGPNFLVVRGMGGLAEVQRREQIVQLHAQSCTDRKEAFPAEGLVVGCSNAEAGLPY